MTTAYTSLLGLALPVTGELSGTWGDTVNTAITSLLDTAIAGTTSITTDADITLSTTTGASNQARQAIILWNPASGTTTRNITAPAQSKMYVVINASGGTQSIVIRGVGPTTGVTIVKGESATVAWNGSDFVKVSTSGGGLSLTDLTVTGNTTLGDAAADTLTVNATSTFNAPVSFAGLVRLPSTGRSAAAALTVTAPAFLYGVASTYTDTTSSGTIAAMAPFYALSAPTLSTSNVTTYTNAATLYIANAPAAGGSATITNPYALYINSGASYLAGVLGVGGVTTLGNNLLFGTDNAYDIGASGATRPRNLYLSSTVNIANAGYATLVNASSANAWSSGYFDIATFYVTNMTAGAVSLNVGKAAGTNNSGKIAFNYAGGSGSTANYVEFGLFNNDGLFRVYGTGNLSNVRSNASVYSGSNSATWVNGLAMTNNATAATGVSNLINFGGTANVNAVYGVVQNASGYGDFVWAGYNGAFTELGRFTSLGYFGIGTATPSASLHVVGAGSLLSGTPPALSATDPSYSGVAFGFDGASNLGQVISTNASGAALGFYTKSGGGSAPTQRMHITAAGFVGVATTTPITALQVSSASLYVLGVKSGTTYGFISLQDGGTSGLLTDGTVAVGANVDDLVFRSGGANRARLGGTGNFGLGVTASAWLWPDGSTGALQLQAGAAFSGYNAGAVVSQNWYYNAGEKFIGNGFASRYSQASGIHIWSVSTASNASGAGAALTWSESMRIATGGTVSMGDTATGYSARLYVNGSIAARNGGVDGTFADAFVAGYTLNYNEKNIIQTAVSSSGVGSGFRFLTSNGAGLSTTKTTLDVTRDRIIFYNDGAEKARIDSGTLWLGKTSASITTNGWGFNGSGSGGANFSVTNNEFFTWDNYNGGGTVQMDFRWNNTEVGSITYTSSAVAFNTTSDYRLKNNPQPLTGSGAFIDALKPKTWAWKIDGSRGVGFLAHELQEAGSSSVHGEKDAMREDGVTPKYQSVEYGSPEFITNIVLELQSLRKRLADAGIA